MNQTQLLAEVLRGIEDMPSERKERINQCRREIQKIVEENDEDGLMALAIEGLKGAAIAEAEEVMTKMKGLE